MTKLANFLIDITKKELKSNKIINKFVEENKKIVKDILKEYLIEGGGDNDKIN